MALIRCSECSKDVSDKAEACPHCGNPIVAAQTLVVVEGYPKLFIGASHVDVYWNGEHIGQVARGEARPFEFPGGGEIAVATTLGGITGRKEYRQSFTIGDGAAHYMTVVNNATSHKRFNPELLSRPPSGPTTFMGISFPIGG